MTVITEDEPLDAGFDMIIPLSVSVSGEEVCVTAENRFRSLAAEFENRFSDSPFSKEARNYIFDSLSDALRGSGYSPDRYAHDSLTVTYMLDSLSEIKNDTAACDVIHIPETEFPQYENLTDFETDELFGCNGERFPLFAVLVGNAVAAVAAVNGSVSGGCAEISVDTAECFRRRGFGRSCTAVAAAYLLKCGINVKYVCFGDNEASCALARSVGFHRQSICFDAVCFADE